MYVQYATPVTTTIVVIKQRKLAKKSCKLVRKLMLYEELRTTNLHMQITVYSSRLKSENHRFSISKAIPTPRNTGTAIYCTYALL